MSMFISTNGQGKSLKVREKSVKSQGILFFVSENYKFEKVSEKSGNFVSQLKIFLNSLIFLVMFTVHVI